MHNQTFYQWSRVIGRTVFVIKLKMNLSYYNLGVKIYIWNRKAREFSEIDAVFDTGAHTTHIDTDLIPIY